MELQMGLWREEEEQESDKKRTWRSGDMLEEVLNKEFDRAVQRLVSQPHPSLIQINRPASQALELGLRP